jgi:broad specificity phosphatase PhoE
MLIYIRHSNDDSDSSFRDDNKLTSRGKKKCHNKCESLVRNHGVPAVIITSPFYRAIQTAKIFQKYILKHYAVEVEVKVETNLGRFFSSDERDNPEIRPSTMKYRPAIDRSDSEMMKRIRSHLRKVFSKGYHKSEKVLWCISHGVILKRLVREYGGKAPEHVDFLQKFICDEKYKFQI